MVLLLIDVNLKTAAKGMAGKFAAAASVSKLPDGSGSEEILIQGDCADDLVDYILKQFPHIKEDLIEIQEMKSKK